MVKYKKSSYIVSSHFFFLCVGGGRVFGFSFLGVGILQFWENTWGIPFTCGMFGIQLLGFRVRSASGAMVFGESFIWGISPNGLKEIQVQKKVGKMVAFSCVVLFIPYESVI